ncbi:MAG: AEC family transporter [Betaproteobacteria bacterium]|nr:AEC family transporter [Rhodocyclales bacterium]
MHVEATVALALLPDFALILLGAGLRRALHLGDHFWSGLEKLVYYVLFPALLFSGLVKTRIDWSAAAPMIGVAAAAMGTGMILGLAARLLPISTMSFASQYQCAFRFNSYIGLAVAGTLYGLPGVAAMGIVVGLMVPPANMAAVWMLARHGEAGVWRELARNPLILATLAGVAANLAGFEPPSVLLHFLGRLSDAAIALGLLAVGAGLRLNGVRGAAAHASASYLLAVKLLAMPATALLLIRWFGLTGIHADIALIFSALPTASSAYILAQRMGGDGARVAWLISAGTLLGMLSLPFWLAWR